MPDLFYNSTNSTDTWSYSSSDRLQRMWEEYQRECERQDHIMEMQMREAEEQRFQEMKLAKELADDKRKYPLLFLKDGIV